MKEIILTKEQLQKIVETEVSELLTKELEQIVSKIADAIVQKSQAEKQLLTD